MSATRHVMCVEHFFTWPPIYFTNRPLFQNDSIGKGHAYSILLPIGHFSKMLSLARAMHDADAAYARIKKGKHLLCVVPMIKLINTQHSYTSCTNMA